MTASDVAAERDEIKVAQWMADCKLTPGGPTSNYTSGAGAAGPGQGLVWQHPRAAGGTELTGFGWIGRRIVVVDITSPGRLAPTDGAAVARTLLTAMARLAAAADDRS